MSSPLDLLLQRYPVLQPLRDTLDAAHLLMRDTLRQGRRIYLCGNGGSAADCEHWAGEMLKGFGQKRPLTPDQRAQLPGELGALLQGGLPVIPLTGFPGLATAVINDIRGDLVYAQLLWALGQPGDLLIGISTSGNAANVAHAMHVARARSIRRLGLTGAHGGKLRELTELCLCVPEHETYRIQELHLPIYHALALALESDFFSTAS